MRSYKQPGAFRTVEAFKEYVASIRSEIQCDNECHGRQGSLGRTIEVCGKQLDNRFCIHPMEGWDANLNGTPSEHTVRRWKHFGASGAKLLWGGEAVAVQADGRANTRQLFNNPELDFANSLRELIGIAKQSHESAGFSAGNLVTGLQLTHSGRFARPWSSELAPLPACRRPAVDKRYKIETAPLATDDQLRRIRDNFVDTARLAQETGFDFVDVKCCHSYLLHDLLGAKDREGVYGGSFENRTRLISEIITRILDRCPNLHIGVRLSLFDFAPFDKDPQSGEGYLVDRTENDLANHFAEIQPDWQPDWIETISHTQAWNEAKALMVKLTDLGVTMLNVTLGSPYYCPHMQRPAAYPPSDGYAPPEDPMIGVARHLAATQLVKRHFPQCTVVGTGYSYLQQWLPYVAQRSIADGNVDFVGMGRMVLAYPELPSDILDGKPLERKKICRTFSDCTTGPRNGEISGCYPLDDYYGSMPQSDMIRKMRASRKS